MKKVLVFGITDNPGGVESFIMNYYRRIDHEKLQFDFLCNTEKVVYEDEIKKLGGKVYRIPARRDGRKKFRTALESFMMENSKTYSAIWVNVCSLANIDYLKAAKKYGISKRIIHCHNAENGDSFLRGVLHKINRITVKKYATDFWSCSDDASAWFFGKNIIKTDKYKVIPNAIDVCEFKRNLEVRERYRNLLGVENKIVIGHAGRFHFQKNHQFLIQVFSELSKLDERYHLLLIGQGELEDQIKEKVKNMGLQHRVSFLGVRSDMAELYQAMDVFVFPSVFEGLGIVALEAQAAGIPCVVADTLPKEVKVNDSLYFMSLNDSPEKWAMVIQEVYQRYKDHVIKQNKMLKSQYNIEFQIKRLEEAFLGA